MSALATHPAAALFPLMAGDAFAALVEDIRLHGQREPILIYEDQVLDGRNRWYACKELGIEPQIEIYAGNDPVALVVSLNLQRRHLNESQRAMVAARLVNLEHGQRADRVEGPIGLSTAAKNLNVGERTVKRARKVLREAAPEIVQAVESGELTVADAVVVADRTRDDQLEALQRSREFGATLKKAVLHLDRERQFAAIQAAPPSLPTGRFECIVVDPPWKYDHDEYDPKWRRAAPLYPTMPLEEIRALPIPALAADESTLWLWTTKDFLRDSFALMEHWGFDYKNVITWVKPSNGIGRWLLNRAEYCVLGTRGKHRLWRPLGHSNVLEAPRREHSRKPEEFYAVVEALCPGRRLDFFSRQPREGWVQYGDRTGEFEATA